MRIKYILGINILIKYTTDSRNNIYSWLFNLTSIIWVFSYSKYNTSWNIYNSYL